MRGKWNPCPTGPLPCRRKSWSAPCRNGGSSPPVPHILRLKQSGRAAWLDVTDLKHTSMVSSIVQRTRAWKHLMLAGAPPAISQFEQETAMMSSGYTYSCPDGITIRRDPSGARFRTEPCDARPARRPRPRACRCRRARCGRRRCSPRHSDDAGEAGSLVAEPKRRGRRLAREPTALRLRPEREAHRDPAPVRPLHEPGDAEKRAVARLAYRPHPVTTRGPERHVLREFLGRPRRRTDPAEHDGEYAGIGLDRLEVREVGVGDRLQQKPGGADREQRGKLPAFLVPAVAAQAARRAPRAYRRSASTGTGTIGAKS